MYAVVLSVAPFFRSRLQFVSFQSLTGSPISQISNQTNQFDFLSSGDGVGRVQPVPRADAQPAAVAAGLDGRHRDERGREQNGRQKYGHRHVAEPLPEQQVSRLANV